MFGRVPNLMLMYFHYNVMNVRLEKMPAINFVVWPDGSLYYQKPYPKSVKGFIPDPKIPGHFIPDFQPCIHRTFSFEKRADTK